MDGFLQFPSFFLPHLSKFGVGEVRWRDVFVREGRGGEGSGGRGEGGYHLPSFES